NTFDNIRSKWESRLRKFTYPLQNTYSVVLRASNVVDNNGPTTNTDANQSENGDNSLITTNPNGEKPSKIDNQSSSNDDGSSSITPGVKFFYHQSISGSPLNGFTSSSMNNQNDPNSSQANQLIRMAALTMMPNEEASREESSPIIFHQSPSSPANQPQPNFAYYSPLSPPSSPILYQYSPSQSQQPSPMAIPQTRPNVVEIPVPVYVPVRVRAPIRSSQPPMMAPVIKPSLIHRSSASSPSPMAIVYYHGNNNEQIKMARNNEQLPPTTGRGMAMIMTNANENAYSQQPMPQSQPVF
ncbi:hypothetical protein BLA29_004585, partial [Euroglyphus maynei]